jgi:hypothetical protein
MVLHAGTENRQGLAVEIFAEPTWSTFELRLSRARQFFNAGCETLVCIPARRWGAKGLRDSGHSNYAHR